MRSPVFRHVLDDVPSFYRDRTVVYIEYLEGPGDVVLKFLLLLSAVVFVQVGEVYFVDLFGRSISFLEVPFVAGLSLVEGLGRGGYVKIESFFVVVPRFWCERATLDRVLQGELRRWSSQDKFKRGRASLFLDFHVVCVGQDGGVFSPNFGFFRYVATYYRYEGSDVSFHLSVTLWVVRRR